MAVYQQKHILDRRLLEKAADRRFTDSKVQRVQGELGKDER